MTDEYITLGESIGEGYYSEKRSKFLAFASHVVSPEEALQIVARYRVKYHDAKHVCYAYRVGVEPAQWRMNDDGEPSSTAGKPIYGQIVAAGLTDVLVVVVRYYGGVNLGTGPLASAYKAAAADALAHAERQVKLVEEQVTCQFAYAQMDNVMRIVRQMQARVVSRDFAQTCSLTLAVPKSQVEALCLRLQTVIY